MCKFKKTIVLALKALAVKSADKEPFRYNMLLIRNCLLSIFTVSGDKRLAILIKSLLLRRTKDQKTSTGQALVCICCSITALNTIKSAAKSIFF